MRRSGPTRTRLTRPGVLCLGAAAVSILSSLLTEVTEFMIGGLFLAGLVAGSMVLVRWGRLDLRIERQVHPRRLTLGENCNVRLIVAPAQSMNRLPVAITDHLDGTAVEVCEIQVGRHGTSTESRYQLRTQRRGIARFGPLRVRRTDPFGLARCERTIPIEVDMIVLPRVQPLGPMSATPSADPANGVRHRAMLSSSSDEFDALREYVPGDDVRRVHWASTARLGRPMVRSHQQPWQRRTTVVLDTRASSYRATDSSHLDAEASQAFERAVSAAASVLVACHEVGDLVRLVTTDGADTGYTDEPQRLESILDLLATITTSSSGNLGRSLGLIANGTEAEERVVTASAALNAADLAAVDAVHSGQHGSVLIDCRSDAAASGADPNRGAASLNTTIVAFGPGVALRDAWQRGAGPVLAPRPNAGAGGRR